MQSQDRHEDGKPVTQSTAAPTAASANQKHAAACPGSGGGGLDTASSNTVSNKYIPEFFKPLRWGIDSLYLSFPGELFSSQETRIIELKKLAQADHIKDQAFAQLELGGHLFEVKDKGAKFFPYILEDNCFRIQLSKASSKAMPMAYVKIASEYLTHKPVLEIVDDLRSVLGLLGNTNYMPNVSRLDLFVDFASSYSIESWDRHAWVTRAKTVNQYAVSGEFSGWSIGMGSESMMSRLYNKLLEIAASNKAYLVPLWQEAGWVPEQDGDVWRLEFEFKRDILSQFEIQPLSAALSNLNGLWSYAATEWLKLTLPGEDKNRSRWSVHPLWASLASVDFETSGGPLSRVFSPQRVPSDRRLFDHGFSVLSSFMAREGITDFYQGMEAFQTALYHYLNNRAMNDGAYLDTYIEERIAIKAKRFNSILNKLGEEALDDAADEYRRQSDGE
ncbi:MAG: replication initiation factor [Methylophilaceae bacterium]|jgi:hypothetical protein|nr:replication initiation factor [Methylophilaceae bacterium]